MAQSYLSSMDVLYRIAMWVSGLALLIMTLIIPVGIFARYVLNAALSWPEPISIICMVTFTFVGAAVSYRSNSHIAVSMLTDRLSESGKKVCIHLSNLLMLLISLFILYYSTVLCMELWEQPVAEFPLLTAGESYLPLPIGSLITVLFIIEKMFFGPQDKRPVVMLGSA
ncbi:TRAP transporter small permease [Pectobacterium brasiliense]|uniref:TRAP transporter small permease protein n=1 Tax=Pectobacterium brasiliense TaxID=180957 RepID=A0A0M2F617_9GAMM|nr:TRAP transporter small permease [Pectobacterium brasiliense]KGA25586.1 C4-dicarboxylate ABC transporter [Pectobacterium brasiliense]KGA36468.1 C4-dicarboxylate ABC transporter [Pectobacterium brasiliense]KRF59235.1 C4-dicarboxylate ABC transporter [Pectobacterium brasiliense]MBN3186715.1 TRAP transporter small permease [Pectobacterium brasiliense]MCA5921455.1 TRAP transporter small permease [Pectobacterium brasiliense]